MIFNFCFWFAKIIIFNHTMIFRGIIISVCSVVSCGQFEVLNCDQIIVYVPYNQMIHSVI